jgi:hypothetical protein
MYLLYKLYRAENTEALHHDFRVAANDEAKHFDEVQDRALWRYSQRKLGSPDFHADALLAQICEAQIYSDVNGNTPKS